MTPSRFTPGILELSRQSCFKSCDHIISGSKGRKLKHNSKNNCNDVDFQASGSDFFLNGRVLKLNSTHKVLLASLLLPEYRSKSVAAHRWSQLLLLILLLMPAEAPIAQVAPPLANKWPALEGFWASPRFKSLLLHFFTRNLLDARGTTEAVAQSFRCFESLILDERHSFHVQEQNLRKVLLFAQVVSNARCS